MSRGPCVFPETTLPSATPAHIKAERKREEPGTPGQDGVEGTVPSVGISCAVTSALTGSSHDFKIRHIFLLLL